MLTVSLDLSGFHEYANRSRLIIQRGMTLAVSKAATEGAEEARSAGRYQDRTGQLRAGIKARRFRTTLGSVTWEILSPALYSKFVEEGTRPHDIRPVNAQALRFVIGGRLVFASVVHHPGGRPYPFMSQGLLKAERVMTRELEIMEADLAQLWAA